MQMSIHNKRKATNNHHVRFAKLAELYEFDDYYDADRPATWYSQNDYSRFEINRISDLRALRRVHGDIDRLDQSHHCIRGLESRMSHDRTLRNVGRRLEVLDVVLDEQDRQEEEAIIDPCSIAFVASRVTHLCQIEALERARQDAEDAKENSKESDKKQPGCPTRPRVTKTSSKRAMLDPPPCPGSPRKKQSNQLSAWSLLMEQIPYYTFLSARA